MTDFSIGQYSERSYVDYLSENISDQSLVNALRIVIPYIFGIVRFNADYGLSSQYEMSVKLKQVIDYNSDEYEKEKINFKPEYHFSTIRKFANAPDNHNFLQNKLKSKFPVFADQLKEDEFLHDLAKETKNSVIELVNIFHESHKLEINTLLNSKSNSSSENQTHSTRKQPDEPHNFSERISKKVKWIEGLFADEEKLKSMKNKDGEKSEKWMDVLNRQEGENNKGFTPE